MTKADIVREFIDEFGNEIPSKTLARVLHKAHPNVFPTPEQARTAVRQVRGQNGNRNRKSLASKSEYFREAGDAGADTFDALPNPIETLEDSRPIEITARKTLILSDIHIPYHDKQALQIALREGQKEQVDTIILNGDVIDFYANSFFTTDPREVDWQRERDMTVRVLQIIREGFPGATIWHKAGNHEERYDRYLKVNAPVLFGVPEFSMESILHLDELDITYVDRRRHLKLGKINVIHGHEFGRSFWNPVNPARGLFLRARATALCGHYHQSSEHNEPNMDGRVTGCWSTGCLCGLSPEYRPYNKWNHGFAIITQGTDVLSGVRNYKIIDGQLL